MKLLRKWIVPIAAFVLAGTWIALADFQFKDAAGSTQTASSVTDGANATVGAKADAACGTGTGTCSLIALIKYLNSTVTAPGRNTSGNSAPVVLPSTPTTYHVIWPNNTTGISVKGSAAVLMSCQMSNNSTTAAYLKIYNKASAPTTGTDVPVITAIVPGPSAGGGGSNISFGPGGLGLSLGLGVAVTTVITDADTTAPAASTIAINCQYE